MTKDLVELLWKGTVVGWIENLKIDHFHIHGGWRPFPSPTLDAFLAEIDAETDDVVVEIGRKEPRWTATIESRPDNEIELLTKP